MDKLLDTLSVRNHQGNADQHHSPRLNPREGQGCAQGLSVDPWTRRSQFPVTAQARVGIQEAAD